jgi:hypothetical protein
VYRHTQTGYVILAVVGATAVALVLGVWQGYLPVFTLYLAGALVIALVLFGSLTVEVGHEAVVLGFGPGLVRRRLPLGEVTGVRVVRNPWWYGWGVHYVGGGWVYNVSGREAVELRYSDGRSDRIGTDEPQALCRAIQGARGLPAN